MGKTVAFDDVLTALPALAATIWHDEVSSQEDLRDLLESSGLPRKIEYNDGLDDDDAVSPRVSTRFQVTGRDDDAASERRLRAAISRSAGKAVGTDKHWDLGSFEFRIRCRGDEFTLDFQRKFSLAAVRAAAADWLAGDPGVAWLLAHELIDSGTEPESNEFWPKPARYSQSTLARFLPDGTVRAHLYLDASSVPTGAKPKSDDAAYELTLAYLEESLGARTDPGPHTRPSWTRGTRTFEFYRMRSRSRSAQFTEAARSAAG
ncbi:hypothetical protein [Leucobacter japonicus]|uniref:hypothetical protein n=1 Tax=Leucobacter japonicus TaxID=1461259 RepID=UPI000A6773BB|nr:hypothetical protein [Leucobacter japonicus]